MTRGRNRNLIGPEGIEPLNADSFHWVDQELVRLTSAPEAGRATVADLENAVDNVNVGRLKALGLDRQAEVGARRVVKIPNVHPQIGDGTVSLVRFDEAMRAPMTILLPRIVERPEGGVVGRISFRQKTSDTHFSGHMFLTGDDRILGNIRCRLYHLDRMNPNIVETVGTFAGVVGMREVWINYLGEKTEELRSYPFIAGNLTAGNITTGLRGLE